MMVGAKAIATLSTGYLNALDYAKNRVQGPDLLRAADKTAPRVTITHHPDVRRSLMLQKAYVEGLRALVCYTASWQDRARTGDDPELAGRVNDLLLPLVKGCGSERAYELLGHEALQTFGGSGFLQDYPIEQYVRDSKIDTLYEGTTAIQSLDLVFRKIVKDGGVALTAVAREIQQFVDDAGANEYSESRSPADGEPAATDVRQGGRLGGLDELKEERLALGQALTDVQGMIAAMLGWLGQSQADEPRALYQVGLTSRRLLLALGDLVVGWLLQRQAEVALRALAGSPSAADQPFYQGKVAAARFFASEVLPRLSADRKIIESTTLDLMDLPEEAF
jgi:alkylation response protein AidB-like acyl-CoA dehydrogenase